MSIKDLLDGANEEYRTTGNCDLSDEEYDYLLDKYGSDKQKSTIGIELSKDKVALPVQMGSLNKIKTVKEINAWISSKDIETELLAVITPKFDGLSLLVEFDEGKMVKAYTRGNGIEGQDVTAHFNNNTLSKLELDDGFTGFIYGEAIMNDYTFQKKYSEKYKNPRNMVAGLLNRKKTTVETEDVSFFAFGIKDDSPTRRHQLDYLNDEINVPMNSQRVTYKSVYVKELGSTLESPTVMDMLPDGYQCDGLVVELSNRSEQDKLGKETGSLNPAYGRAWKPESVNQKTTTVRGVRWQVSKSGLLKPVVEIEPVDIGGVTISNVTGNNAKFIEENNICEGTVVSIIRSGDVIPKIVKVIYKPDSDPIPKECPCCSNTDLEWCETQTELICGNVECSDRVISALVHFFKTMDVDDIREGTIKQLYFDGFDTVEKICTMTVEDFQSLDGFQRSKAQNCYNAIREKAICDLETIQHASNLFGGLGSRKLKLLRQYNKRDSIPLRESVLALEGFSDKSADVYLNNIVQFWEFNENLPFKIKEFEDVAGGPFENKNFVFTGFRDKELAQKIELLGGKISSGVSKKTSYLVCSSKGSGSAKESKALDVGATILDRSECIEMVSSLS